MTTTNKILSIALAIVTTLLILKSCKKDDVITVKYPEQKGQFKTDTIKEQITVYVPKPYKDRTNEKKLLSDINELNTQLELYKEELDNAIDEFTYMDSINKSKAYAEAIALREFNQPFENEFIKIENSGYTFGTLKSLKTTYTIKEREVDVNVPKSKVKISVSPFIGSNTELNNLIYGANLNINKASVSYIRVNKQNYFTIGRSFDIIK